MPENTPASPSKGSPPPLPGAVSDPRRPVLAGLGLRFLALLMDVIPVAIFSAFLLWQILLPMYHGEALRELVEMVTKHYGELRQAEETGGAKPDTPDFSSQESILLLFSFSHQVVFIVFFVYFGFSEWLMRGATLGKRMFSIHTVMSDSGLPPSPIQAMLRGAMKAFGLVGLPPWSWLSFMLALFLGRRTGHDILCRTAVVGD